MNLFLIKTMVHAVKTGFGGKGRRIFDISPITLGNLRKECNRISKFNFFYLNWIHL
jgi:hypothetical protein